MRISIVSCVFPPEPVVSGRTSLDIAQGLLERGHKVTVITSFPSKPSGKLYPGFSRRLFAGEQAQEGFELVRCFSTMSPKSRLLSRFLENITFGLTSSMAILFMRRSDVIYANTWPIFASGLLFIMAKIRRIPMVISVQDVYPESLVSQGRSFAKKLFTGWLLRWDGVMARGCRKVIVISKRFADLYFAERRVPKENICIVPNWGDDCLLNVGEERLKRFRASKSISIDARVFVYGGNIGVAAGVETLVQAIKHLNTAERFHLLIAGEGSQLDLCKVLARELSDGLVTFHTPWRADETELVLGLAEVLLLPTRGRQSHASVPSKLISYWLAGKPVIAMAWPQSDLADLVENSSGGWLVEPDRPDLLAAKIDEVLGLDPDELRRRGQAGRDFAMKNLTRENCLPRVVAILEQAGGQ
jgi:glycosyltransferase involved in cell wall biosynthesis